MVDRDRAPIIKKMYEKVAYEKWSGRKVYHWLKFDINFKTKGNKNLSLSNIYIILQNSFYYGVFEYPEKSGNWYTGKHTPIITKELFDQAQEQLKRDRIVRSEIKEFAFTKLMNCGLCGSGITADEKFKKLKDGTTVRYVYYGCTRGRDLHCKCGYINEIDLIKQFEELIEKIDIDEIGIKEKIKEEIERFKGFQRVATGIKGKVVVADIDIRNYAKYVLREGKDVEKRELLGCLKSKIELKNKIITLL